MNALFVCGCWFMDALPTLTPPPVVPPLLRPCCLKSCCLEPRSCSRLSDGRRWRVWKASQASMEEWRPYMGASIRFYLSFSWGGPSVRHVSSVSLQNPWPRPAKQINNWSITVFSFCPYKRSVITLLYFRKMNSSGETSKEWSQSV